MKRYLATIALALAWAAPAAAGDALTVYTYESFTAEWGPGPQVEAAFEKQCGCDLRFVSVADGVALLNRVKLEGEATQADIVLGLDTNLTAEARATGLFSTHGLRPDGIEVPGGWSDDTFLPFDYGYFAFVYDSLQVRSPPRSLDELVHGGAGADKVAIQDPRTSTPGLGLVLWMRKVYGDGAPQAWASFRERILTVTPGWSESYGLLTSGEAPIVLSYLTDTAYHRITEGSDRFRALSFPEGHYLQVEVAGMTKRGAANPLAGRFLDFMLSPAFQDVVPETNWMFPAGRTQKPLNPILAATPEPAKTLAFSPEEVAANRKAWIDEWLEAMSR